MIQHLLLAPWHVHSLSLFTPQMHMDQWDRHLCPASDGPREEGHVAPLPVWLISFKRVNYLVSSLYRRLGSQLCSWLSHHDLNMIKTSSACIKSSFVQVNPIIFQWHESFKGVLCCCIKDSATKDFHVMDGQCILFNQHGTKINKNKGWGLTYRHTELRDCLSDYKPHILTNTLYTHTKWDK